MATELILLNRRRTTSSTLGNVSTTAASKPVSRLLNWHSKVVRTSSWIEASSRLPVAVALQDVLHRASGQVPHAGSSVHR
jgi:hypothetical protein